MLPVAERGSTSGLGVGYMLVALAQAKLGNALAAKEALDRMRGFAPLTADPAAYLQRNGVTENIRIALIEGLEAARDLAAGP